MRSSIRPMRIGAPRAARALGRPPGGVPSERRRGGEGMSATTSPLLEVNDLVVRYPIPRGLVGAIRHRPHESVHAVEGVSFSLRKGEMLALVGESGCGKTTTA